MWLQSASGLGFGVCGLGLDLLAELVGEVGRDSRELVMLVDDK